MERIIKVSLEKAKMWYISGNQALYELALQVYTKEELETPTYAEIAAMVDTVDCSKEETILRILSQYYKKSTDKFYPDQEKYFIGKNSYEGWTIIKHSSVLYPGIAYYLRQKDAIEALKIFLKEMGYDK